MPKLLKQFLLFLGLVLVCGGVSLVVLVDQSKGEDDEQQSLTIKKAKWEKGDGRLIVKGEGPARQQVVITDTETQVVLGTIRIREKEWRLRVSNPSSVPCRVSATTSQGESAERKVKDAPSNCGGITNLPPDGTILIPASTVTIEVGEAIEFSGEGNDLDGNFPL